MLIGARRLGLVLIALLLVSTSATAEDISLDDGSRLSGTIRRMDAKEIELETPQGVMTIKRDRVRRIDTSRPQSAPPRKFRIHGEVDYFLSTTVDDGLRSDGDEAARFLIKSGGHTNATYSLSTAGGGVGGRLGLLVPTLWQSEMGFSVGYVVGPQSTQHLEGTGKFLVTAAGFADAERSMNFLRFVAQARREFTLADDWAVDLGAGAGVARGTVEDRCLAANGGLKNACSGSVSKSWTGFTWEVSPAIRYRIVRIGARITGFPTFGGTDDLSRITWTSYGFFGGILY